MKQNNNQIYQYRMMYKFNSQINRMCNKQKCMITRKMKIMNKRNFFQLKIQIIIKNNSNGSDKLNQTIIQFNRV